jgi:hypothetical protein
VEYRQVGNTELQVSEIGFGCGGNAGRMVRGSPEEQQLVVVRAIELGGTRHPLTGHPLTGARDTASEAYHRHVEMVWRANFGFAGPPQNSGEWLVMHTSQMFIHH